MLKFSFFTDSMSYENDKLVRWKYEKFWSQFTKQNPEATLVSIYSCQRMVVRLVKSFRMLARSTETHVRLKEAVDYILSGKLISDMPSDLAKESYITHLPLLINYKTEDREALMQKCYGYGCNKIDDSDLEKISIFFRKKLKKMSATLEKLIKANLVDTDKEDKLDQKTAPKKTQAKLLSALFTDAQNHQPPQKNGQAKKAEKQVRFGLEEIQPVSNEEASTTSLGFSANTS